VGEEDADGLRAVRREQHHHPLLARPAPGPPARAVVAVAVAAAVAVLVGALGEDLGLEEGLQLVLGQLHLRVSPATSRSVLQKT
jgi:hypothetical protein